MTRVFTFGCFFIVGRSMIYWPHDYTTIGTVTTHSEIRMLTFQWVKYQLIFYLGITTIHNILMHLIKQFLTNFSSNFQQGKTLHMSQKLDFIGVLTTLTIQWSIHFVHVAGIILGGRGHCGNACNLKMHPILYSQKG